MEKKLNTPYFLLSERFEELNDWQSPERLKMGYRLAKETLRQDSESPALDLLLQIGVARQTMYNWTAGNSRPYKIYLEKIDSVFSRILGDDWPEKVDRKLTEQDN